MIERFEMSNELSNVNGGGEVSMRPSYLPAATESQAGTQLLTDFIVPPRLKIVQPQSDAELKKNFSEGTIVLSPQMIEIPAPFTFTPILFYPEWITWNPRKLSHLPVIRERTLDPTSQLVQKCRNPALWSEPCPEDPNNPKNNLRHCEHLVFIVVIHGVEGLENTPVVISFSRSEHSSGQSFATLLKMRNADIFACNFDAFCNHRKNTDGNWYGLDIRNPGEVPPWVSEEEYNRFKALHEMYLKAHESRTLRADLSEGSTTTNTVDAEVAAEV